MAPRARSDNLSRSPARDRKSTRLNSSHGYISYAVFCLKKKKKHREQFARWRLEWSPLDVVVDAPTSDVFFHFVSPPESNFRFVYRGWPRASSLTCSCA